MRKKILQSDCKRRGCGRTACNLNAPYIEHTVITYEYDVPTVEEFRGRIRHVLERYPYLVAEVNGEICGYAYASAFHERPAGGWNVETSIYVDQNKRNGYRDKLYDMLEKY